MGRAEDYNPRWPFYCLFLRFHIFPAETNGQRAKNENFLQNKLLICFLYFHPVQYGYHCKTGSE